MFVHQRYTFLLLVQLTPVHCISFLNKVNGVINHFHVIGYEFSYTSKQLNKLFQIMLCYVMLCYFNVYVSEKQKII